MFEPDDFAGRADFAGGEGLQKNPESLD